MSSPSLYLAAAQDLDRNPGQKQAYESQGHCVVLAGPGSGKTKTLTLKMARMLAEDVRAPRGIACITYSNECARELAGRLRALGILSGKRVFIGTVHSFALCRIIIPYARFAPFPLPDPIRVADRSAARGAVERAYPQAYADAGDPHDRWKFASPHRRAVLDRTSLEWRAGNPERADFIETYERELHDRGFIDFDDMPFLGLQLLKSISWLPAAIKAQYPIILVDEYQDLGKALDAMVDLLCFKTGCRLFAVGDPDQSIYGFQGAEPGLLSALTRRPGVETVRLEFNYRCGRRIISASEAALGEERGYRGPDGAAEGEVYFHPLINDYEAQARYVVKKLIPAAMERQRIPVGRVAVLYRRAKEGQFVADAANADGIPVVRADNQALYPRDSRLLRWIEECALWACGGWRTAEPSFRQLLDEGCAILYDTPSDDRERRRFEGELIAFLQDTRARDVSLGDWLTRFRRDVLTVRLERVANSMDEQEKLKDLIMKVGPGSLDENLTVQAFCGANSQGDRLVLSTLHSAKGREFPVVVLFGLDNTILPNMKWESSGKAAAEARRLFYVGLTRAEREVHLVFSKGRHSPFVAEVHKRLHA